MGLVLRNIAKNWTMPAIAWRAAKDPFPRLSAERFTQISMTGH
jgi:transposase-like protein